MSFIKLGYLCPCAARLPAFVGTASECPEQGNCTRKFGAPHLKQILTRGVFGPLRVKQFEAAIDAGTEAQVGLHQATLRHTCRLS